LAEAHSNLGMMYHLQGRLEPAIESFRAALRLNPRLSSARLFLGIDYYLTSRPDQAIAQLQQAVSLDSHDAQAREWLGMSYLYTDNYTRAVTELRLCRLSDPGTDNLTFHLARAYLRLSVSAFDSVGLMHPDSFWDHLIKGEQRCRHVSDALEEFQRALLVDPVASGVHFRRAVLFETQGKAASAIEEYGKELLDRPHHVQSIINLVQLLRGLELSKEADEVLSLARTSLEGHPQTLALLARLPEQNPSPAEKGEVGGEGALSAVRIFLGNYEERIRSLPRSVEWAEQVRSALDRSDPEDALRLLTSPTAGIIPDQVQEWKAEAWIAHGDFGQALDILLQLTAKEPDNPEYSYYLGNCTEKLALSTLDEFVRKAPDSYRTYQLRAEYYAARSDAEKAVAAYEKALALKPKAIEIHLALGKIYQSDGHYDRAIAEYEAELKTDSYSVPALERIGEIYYKLDRADRAKKYLLQAISINPNSPQAHLWLGKVNVQEGSYVAAVQHFRAALKGGAKDPEAIYFQLSRTLRQLGRIEEADHYLVLFGQSKAEKSRKEQRRSEDMKNAHRAQSTN